ncbi:major histocompatibility complex class I-related gene protein-like isoform X2 [Xiphophorus hellerii]|uniref:major histocompatibility complex class I-related gene protein-like isoform X2 n=1 Tax=Xiphophorus hellerii TaxID=8084 RepID=UPI0013B3D0D0|nr:major histocompatibility complex class I-related gene protein-like isoform X2 [Xiphophorus hellerii]
MKQLFVVVLYFQAISAVMHSWKAFYTGTTGMSEFPEFVALNLLDDELMGYFDGKTNRFEGKQSWVTEKLGQEYVERQTNVLQGVAQTFKGNIDIAMKRFNQSQGVHIVQFMYGCEWDDDTQKVTGYQQYGYDGEDFITLNMESNTYLAPKQQAFMTTDRWNKDRAYLESFKNYVNQECPDWLKKYVNYGKSSLMRTELPSVSVLQSGSSSKVSCHATGFYPNRAEMFWRKDGEEIHDGVIKGEILPNNDGTFQMSVNIDLSSVPTEDRTKYECVFQLSGVNEDIIHKLNNESNITKVIIPIVAAVAVIGLIVIGIILYKKKNAKRPPSPVVNGQPPEETQFLPQA